MDASKNYKIILFLCNWGAYAAYEALQARGGRIPPEISMVRIPCAGRMTKALLFKAFEMGADGVMLAGCRPGSCRYGVGTESAVQVTEDTREILALLGMDRDRLRFGAFLPDEVDAFEDFVMGFRDRIMDLGKSPVTPPAATELPAEAPALSFSEILARHNVYECQDCGKCTASCPLALAGKAFSPRAIAAAVIKGDFTAKEIVEDVWSCLTCGLCYARCPSDVNFPEFIGDVRALVKSREDGDAHQAHGGFFQSLMRAMTSPRVATQRWTGLPEDIRVDHSSKILFFGGCAPYFDTFFRHHLGVRTTDMLVDSLRLMNFFDVAPSLLEHERCCGHDLLWSGDRENFLALARLNVEMIKDQGIEEVVTACPECFRTLSMDYPRFGVETGFKVTHLYAFLDRQIDKGAVAFNAPARRMTIQDSCRLNSFADLKDLPRKLMARMAPGDVTEMKDYKDVSMCCGNCAWTGCDAYSKAMQVERLKRARETGVDLLVTSCPKCQVHLQCAMEDPFQGDALKMEIQDLTRVIREAIRWE